MLWPIFLLLGVEHVRIEPGHTRLTLLDFYDDPRDADARSDWPLGLGPPPPSPS